jgi:ribonucleoside-diphosphate reductase alpha chain
MMANWSKNAKEILEKRYLLKDKKGAAIETPDGMLSRVAKYVSSAEKEEDREKWHQQFMSILDTLEFLPNSPTLMNAGKPEGQLAACFVLDIADDMSNIFETVKQCALIHKTGGGTGLIFSKLRPANSLVRSTSGVASGPVSFMNVFNSATEAVKQGGVRRGANLGLLHISHPDIEEFIKCKSDKSKFQNFNISVGVTDNFMKAVAQGNSYPLRHPRMDAKKYVKAQDLFNEICHQAWLTGDPGLLFLDTIESRNPTPWLGRLEGVNPCGETPLIPGESCNLGSIDISKMVQKDGRFNWDRLEEVVVIAVRFLDNIIDVNHFPNIKIERATKRTRKLGLGVMGFADALILMGIKYNSEKAQKFAKRLIMNIREIAHMSSRDLGKEKGFGEIEKLKRRNATLTVIAPTGTLSMLADCSSGIEPVFAKKFTKTVMDGAKMDLSSKYDSVSEDLLVTAHDISIFDHIKIQAAFQTYTDGAVSKTINLPADATEEDVRKTFMFAWESGCKGITVYRDGSRQGPLDAVKVMEKGVTECENGRCSIL